MKHTYQIDGMTCNNCKESVTKALKSINGVKEVFVNFEDKTAVISMSQHIDINTFQNSLSDRYKISSQNIADPTSDRVQSFEESKLKQLKPLFLILFYITSASILLHIDNLDYSAMMIDFMGLFFIVFSFFKMLDLNGFATSFKMYDPIAKAIPVYAKFYPFLETILGLMLLMRFEMTIALIVTIVILGFTTIGVTQTLFSKRKIKCACLGTALNLPMTEATFIENVLMIIMALLMLIL